MTDAHAAAHDPDDPFRYSYPIDTESESTAARVIRRVGHNKRVLELGCAAGHMSAALRERGCQVVGVELDPALAAHAAQVCERVIVGDLDALDLEAELAGDSFDVIVAADVLEHLRQPGRLLRRLRPCLRSGGYLVISMPNVAHGSVRLALLGGEFPYQDLGLLDRTHLRFYTYASLEQLLADADFAIGHLERVLGGIVGAEVPWDQAAVPSDVVQTLEQDTEALTYQFIVVAYPLPSHDMQYLRERMNGLVAARDRAECALRGLSQTNADLQAQVAALQQSQPALTEANARLTEQAASLTAQVAELTAQRDALALELDAARARLAEQTAHLATLQEQVELRLDNEVQIRGQLLEARDRALELESERVDMGEALKRAYDELHWMRGSKSWQWIERLWAIRQRLRRG